jgi:Chaperone of endosialidase/Head domain of trimeric autotransporter adhesin
MKTKYLQLLAILCFLLTAGNLFSQSLSVNTDGSSADASAMLDVKSGTKGILVPRLTLVQRNAVVNPATSLLIYQLDNSSGYYYNAGTPGVPDWKRVAVASENFWQQNGNHIYNTNTGYVGIGINTPLARLHVADSSVLFSAAGDAPVAANIPLQGAGRRMMWYADKAAFRAGYVSGTEWNDNVVGKYSVAFGRNTTASGFFSTAFGEHTLASGDRSFASGYYASATGNGTAIFGYNSSAVGNNSFVVGENNGSTGNHSITMGYANVVTGQHAYSIGNANNIAGDNITSIGQDNIIYGNNSYVFGNSNNVAQNSMAIGYDNTIISGSGGSAFGNLNTVQTNAQAFGSGNNVDDNSFAVGWNCISSMGGWAFGSGATASNNLAFAIGKLSSATGENDLSIGISSQASGSNSTAIGNMAGATAVNAVSIGNNTVASQSAATAIGQSADASGIFALSIGSGIASGSRSISIGASNASGDSSTAIGYENFSYGNHAVTLGNQNIGRAYAGTVMGSFNDDSDLPDGSTPALTDRLFQVGNGTDPANKKNAFTMLRNGYSGFGTNNLVPLAPVHVKFNSGPTAQVLIEETENDYSRLRYSNSGIANFWDIAAVSKTAGNNAAAELNFYYQGMPGNILSLRGDGNATLTGTLTQLSDARYKVQVKPLDNSLQKIMLLTGYHYYWKDKNADQSLQTGVLAQELQMVVPELVKQNDQGMLSVNYAGLVPLLIESIKEQQAKINRLEKILEDMIKRN